MKSAQLTPIMSIDDLQKPNLTCTSKQNCEKLATVNNDNSNNATSQIQDLKKLMKRKN